jgi:chitodextrinase
LSAGCGIALALLTLLPLSAGVAGAQTAIAYVQGTSAVPQSPKSSVTAKFSAAQTAGDLNVVVVGWNDSTARVQSVSDSSGNLYVRAIGPTVRSGQLSQSVYYAANISAAAAGSNTVTVAFDVPAEYVDLRMAEYSGIATTNPVDAVVGAQGSGTTANSGATTITSTSALLVGANMVTSSTLRAGTSFTARMITSPDGDILEDRVVSAAGSYSATAPTSGGGWVMQMVAFRAQTGSADAQPPSIPSGLSAVLDGGAAVRLSWAASTDNVGVAGYRIERCQGVGCGAFALIGTSATAEYSDSEVVGPTVYGYRVRATDATGNLSAPSDVSTVTVPGTPHGIFVQVNAATPQDTVDVVTVPFSSPQAAGNLNVVVVGWNAPTGQVQSVTDASGNSYVLAVGPTVNGAFGTQSVYFAPNIRETLVNSVTVRFTTPQPYPDVRIAEYAGLATSNPVDAVSAAVGSGTLSDSGVATTVNSTDLLVAANLVTTTTTGAGAGFTARLITSPDGDILEDQSVTAAGAYNATAPLSSGAWIMQVVAFKAAATGPDTQAPTAPANLAITSLTSSQAALSWTASVDDVAVAAYAIERCSGNGCSAFSQVGSSTSASFVDGTISPSTTYSYRVRAIDTAANVGPYSSVLTVNTPAPPDTQPPTAPTGLSATSGSATQVDLSWTSAIDNIGVTGYRIERCAGNNCSSFAQVATSSSPGYSDTTVIGATTYGYRVRATDAAGNLSAYSAVATVTTATPPDTQPPTVPTALSATAATPTQVSLGWTASTDNVGVTSYLVERCVGAGCGSFAQVGTSANASFFDGTVAASTSYNYRIRASDAAGNLSGYSATASVTTPAAPDTQAPTVPGGLVATATAATQVTLAWSASTDNVGVTSYRVERCAGAGCSGFAQIGTSASVGYSDSSVTGSTSYSYRVRAEDAAGNLSGYSPATTTTTPAPPDTQAPTSPASLTATANSASQVTLGWSSSTDNVGVTSYLVERCTGTSCSGFAQVGTTTAAAFTDNTVSGSTSYQYRVRAADAAGNLSAYSASAPVTTPAVPDTQAPTAPTSLNASATAATQVALVWAASIDDVGVSAYRIERCTGANCTAFVEIGSTSAATYTDATVTGSSAYRYRVRATDLAGNLSGYSPNANVTTPQAAAAPAFIQVNAATPQTPTAVVTLAFKQAQAAGNLNVVVVGWNNPSGSVLSVSDSAGNAYAVAAAAIVNSTFGTQAIYYAPNVVGAAANSVTVRFSAPVDYPDVRIAEYSGVAPVDPVDGAVSAVGSGTTSSSGALVTKYPATLLVAANLVTTTTAGAGTGYQARVITTPDGDILQDQYVSASGAYAANAPLNSGQWIMQLVAFKVGSGVPDVEPPSAPGSVTASAVSGTRVDVMWTAAADNFGVAGYVVERCTGVGCTGFGPVGTVDGSSRAFSDVSVTPDTAYRYRVMASDAAGNAGPYSTEVSVSTPGPDTNPPTAPGTLVATAVSGTQIDLVWGAATDDTGVVGYRVERCQGAGCTQFSKFGSMIAGTSYSDANLSLNTSYSYIVRAQDAAGNVGPYTNIATAVTLATNPHLVAAYSFDEGTGTTVGDLSGHANNGVIENATWTASGRFGNALLFNGSNAMVTVPDSASLRLTTGMTLEAWVNPSVANSGWKDVVYKGNDNYYLEGATPSGVPMIGVNAGGSAREAFSGAALPPNTWTFLAATYDGTTVRLYVNGTQVASQTASGTITTSAYPLQIGGDSIWGQFFQGRIDEVRVYDTALTTGQVQADMATAVGGVSPAASLSTLNLDFGSQAVGTSVQRPITLTNGGAVSLSVTSISIAGAEAGDYTQTNDCGGALVPAAFCTIMVQFAPGNTGNRNAILSINDNAPGSPHTVSLTGTGAGFGLTPRISVVTPGQSQQFAVNDLATTGAVWSVDGLVGGNSSIGTISAAGLFTPPATAGVHVVGVTADGGKSASATVYVATSPGMFTHHNDDARTGQNLSETVLKPSNVNSTSFGKLGEFAIDGIAHASPLYVANVSIPGVGKKNVVYVATEHDSVYAFDADARTSTPLWKVSFINPAAGITTVPNGDTGECCDIRPEIGITGTPVIDPATSTLYVVAKTKEGTSTYRQRLHALDLATGAEKFGGPVLISATVPGSGTGSSGGQLSFDALRENQRTALLLHNGVVYFGFGSHGDVQPYHGWLLGYNATTLQQVFVFNATPNGEGGGIWQSGGGLAIDSAGNFFFATGDGSFSLNAGGKDYGDTFIKLSPAGAVIDTFTPHDEDAIDGNNLDLDAGGMILLPDQPGPHPHLLVSAGKNGTIYVVDRDNMGGFHPADQNVQTLANIFPFGTPLPGNYSSPVYYNGVVYFAPVADVVQAFSVTNGLLSASPTATTPQAFSYPGAALAVSADGANDGILWAVQKNGTAAGTLRAYDATNITRELYNSDQAANGRDQLDVAAKFSIPLVINGRVYVASEGKLTIYGLLP